MKVQLSYLGAGRLTAASRLDEQILDEHLTAGDLVCLTEDNSRSMKQHRWLFALVRKAFDTLPMDQVLRFPSEEHLRKYALIKAGWCDINTQSFSTPEMAKLAAKAFKIGANITTDGRNFTMTVVRDDTVMYVTPRSISLRACKGAEWESACQGVVNYLCELLHCDVTQLLDGVAANIPEWVRR